MTKDEEYYSNKIRQYLFILLGSSFGFGLIVLLIGVDIEFFLVPFFIACALMFVYGFYVLQKFDDKDENKNKIIIAQSISELNNLKTDNTDKNVSNTLNNVAPYKNGFAYNIGASTFTMHSIISKDRYDIKPYKTRKSCFDYTNPIYHSSHSVTSPSSRSGYMGYSSYSSYLSNTSYRTNTRNDYYRS